MRKKELYKEIQKLNAELELRIRPEEYPDLLESLTYWQNEAFAAKADNMTLRYALQQVHLLATKMMEDLLNGGGSGLQ